MRVRIMKHGFSMLFAVIVFGSGGRSIANAEPVQDNRASATMPCPSAAALKQLLDLGSIYFGEVHGTNEAPHLVRCVVDAEVAGGIKPLVVSVELPSFSRDVHSLFWTNPDGRSSKAMSELVSHLESLEQQGKITIDFQLGDQDQSDEEMNRQVGMRLRDLSKKERVIALGGNLHSQRKQVLIPSLAVTPAGSYIGDHIKSVMIDAVEDGTAWNCTTSCGPHKARSFSGSSQADSLIDGKAAGHDYLFTVDRFSASEPAIKKGNAP